jgi:hypothetical protein
MIAIRKLGESFLWVDALCIPQDDEKELSIQIQSMDTIYSNALVTLIAAEGSDSNAGLPGVRPCSRNHRQHFEVADGFTIYTSTPLLHESILSKEGTFNSQSSTGSRKRFWAGRGWTFQEGLLSTRCLIFTANQSFLGLPWEYLLRVSR